MVTTSTAIFPTSAFLSGLKRNNSRIPPNKPQKIIAKKIDK